MKGLLNEFKKLNWYDLQLSYRTYRMYRIVPYATTLNYLGTLQKIGLAILKRSTVCNLYFD